MTCPICHANIAPDALVGHLHRSHGLALWRVLDLLREMAEALGREVEAKSF
jgi:hypothetical protein